MWPAPVWAQGLVIRFTAKITLMELINLLGRRVLITQSDDFMGPALARVFSALGAKVIADPRALSDDPDLARRVVDEAGGVDVLIAHLALPAPTTPVSDVDEDEWRRVFAHLVDPLPQMRARGAQLAWVRAAGVELARENIQLNAIAQNFVDNPTYFPPEVQANPAFQERLKREVPLGRLVSGDEDALFAAYLASDAAACFVGQVFPVSGGWVA